ncbi:collagen, type XXVIII, alpha 1b [Hippoglossus stenolepis]|uniref:collagen, type XXVIII, alpha 1b n=1 Tax=Hippoglossus stenolepis TaxID=195615 RepID=UPI00159BF580|nr:collagen, type XXVIII, alpha 1b [Hippoglossus stenolepis]
MLLRANLRRGAGLCLLLLTLVHEATSQRQKSGRRSNYRLHNDEGGHGPCSLEVVFIVDSSESAKTVLFQRQKKFVLSFSTRLSTLQVAGWKLQVRMAALQYSSSVSVEQRFSAWKDLDSFHGQVSAMSYIGHGTYTTYAITNASQLLVQETPADSVRVAVLMTDGVDHPRNPDVIAAAAEAKGHGIRFFAVGLSNIAQQSPNSAKLRAVASAPAQQFVQSLLDAQLEETLLREMAAVASEGCPQAQVCLCERGERGPPGSAGRKGDPGLRGSSGVQGARGESGLNGRPGSDGIEGLPGHKGNKGERGDCGTPGTKGDAGPEGLAGPRGSHGEQGSLGPAGDSGPEGPAGPKGDRGFVGAAGAPGERGIGFPGAKGEKGNDGRPGPTGLVGIGEPGLPGPQGPSGALGNPGPPGEGFTGPKGDRGYQGPRGIRGLPGAGVKGDMGSRGPPGISGPLGAPGSGPQGDKGDQGPVGPSGLRGAPGIGITGPKGIQGVTGEPGLPGERGVGQPGPKGDPGAEGVAGIPGQPGEDGTLGKKGDLGLPGLRGPDGAPGKGAPGGKGDRGDRGSRGLSGAVGPVGPMGPKGEPGIIGRVGSTGAPGRGIPGAKGEPGPQGPAGALGGPGIGLTGPKGDRGTPGPAGSPGPKSEGVPGPPGLLGSPGLMGEAGPEGVGLPGPKGDRGLPGPSGPAGLPGIGLIGPKGSVGQMGQTGPQGLTGEGIQGQKGEPGFQGVPGPRGPTGLGVQGSKGDRGLRGEKGRGGDRGKAGEPGTIGSLGRAGQKGEAGLTREEVVRIVRSICSCGVTCRQTPLELVFVIDSSESVGPDNFNVIKDFVNALIDRASVSRDTTRVGVVLYSHINMVVVSLEQVASPDQVKSAVRSMTYIGEGTFTGSAIQQANQVFRGARAGVRKVAIVITDGQADKRDSVQLERAVAEAQASNIETFVVGVVNQSDPLYEEFKKELNLMASDPDSDHVYLIDEFKTLPALEKKLLSRICEDGERHLFSSIPSSGNPPGVPETSGNVREPPYRTDTDTPTFTGDSRRVQMVPGAPGSPLDREEVSPQRPKPDTRAPTDTQRFPFFDWEPFRPVTELLPRFEGKKPSTHTETNGAAGPAGPTVKAPPEERTPPPSPQPPPLVTSDTGVSAERCIQVLDPGPCRDYVVRWYYDANGNSCAQFWFGGCQGNSNQFENERSCKETCVKV